MLYRFNVCGMGFKPLSRDSGKPLTPASIRIVIMAHTKEEAANLFCIKYPYMRPVRITYD